MNGDFPRILTLLRKGRTLSQKQAAQELGISQALLSHYEKGIRECGLDFVLRCSEYYGVSCDYLLGKTPQRTGAVIKVDDLPNSRAVKPKKNDNSAHEYNRRIIVNTINLVFAVLKETGSNALTHDISVYLSASLYIVFRLLYSSNEKSPQATFTIDKTLYSAVMNSIMSLSLAQCANTLSGNASDGAALKNGSIPSLSPEYISENYPQYASSLFDLISNTENSVRGMAALSSTLSLSDDKTVG